MFAFLENKLNMTYNKNFEKQISDDEIDLKKALLQFFLIIRKWLKLFVAFIIAGLLIGFLMYLTENPLYQSNLVLRTKILQKADFKSLISNIDKLLQESNYGTISENFALDSLTSSELKSIEIDDSFHEESENTIQINVMVSDYEALDELQRGIIHYLESNDYIEIRRELHKEKLAALIEKLNFEIENIEELKQEFNQGNILPQGESGSNIVFMDPSKLNREALELYQQVLNFEEELKLIESIQIISEFNVYKKPVSPILKDHLANGLIIGFFFSIIIVAFLELNNRVLKHS